MYTATGLDLRRSGEALPFAYRLPKPQEEGAIGLSTARTNKIFISYASEDDGFARILDRKLRERDHDPWVDFDDIVEGRNREAQVQQGIEEADVLVFIVTPAAIQSRLTELERALALNKLLIFVLWQPTDSVTHLPTVLQNASWLKLPWKRGSNSLLELNSLTDFIVNMYAFAKLFIRAHVWQQREYPQELLLRDEDIEAIITSQHRLKQVVGKQVDFSPGQSALIKASKAHTEQEPDILLSYSRRDREFAERLYTGLTAAGYSPWVDWKNIPVAADWLEEVKLGILAAHTFIFIISPDSVDSIHCSQEIEFARQCNKRIITVLWRDDYDVKRLKALGLSRLQYVSFRNPEKFDQILKDLLKAIRTDLGYARRHQRLMRQASEWDGNGRKSGFLLSRQQFGDVKRWQQHQSSEHDLPGLTPLQQKYIEESELTLKNIENKRKRIVMAFVGSILGTAVLALSAFSATVAIGEIRALVNSLEQPHGLDALEVALKASRRFKRYGLLISGLRPDLEVRVVTALHRELYNLRAANYLPAHAGRAFSVAFSPDGTVLASGGEDGAVKLWTNEGIRLAELSDAHEQPVISLDFSADGKLLASGSYDGDVKLWSPDGETIRTLPQPHSDRIIAIRFSPGAQLLASASEDKTVQLWSRREDFRTPIVLPHETAVRGLSFSPYGDKLATTDDNGIIYLWSSEGEPIGRIDNQEPVLFLEFSPDGKTIVSADLDGHIRLRAMDGQPLPLEDNQHIGAAYRAKFSPSGRFLASAGSEGTIKVWSKQGELLHRLQGHLGAVYRLQFTDDERLLISAGADDTIKLWSVKQGLLLEEFEGHRDEILGLATTSEPKWLLASASASGAVILWNLSNPLYTLPHTNRVYTVTYRPDGRIIASGGRQTIRLWNQQGELISHIQATEPLEGGVVNSLDYSPNSELLASGDSDGEIKIWQPAVLTDRPIHEFAEKHASEIKAIRFSPDGRLLASASVDGSVKLWSVDGELIDTLAHQAPVFDLVFVPKRNWLITASQPPGGSSQGDITLWKLTSAPNSGVGGGLAPVEVSAEKLMTFSDRYPNEVGPVTSISVDPEAELLVSGSMNADVKLWNLNRLDAERTRSSGLALQANQGSPKTLTGHTDAVLDVGISPNGDLLASASQDGTVKLWTRSGRLISTLDRHDREVASLQFHPQTNTELASASFDRKVLLWQLPKDFTHDPLGLLITAGCESVQSYLTMQEDISDRQGDNGSERSTVKEMLEFCSTQGPR